MTTINNLTIEQMREIVDGAPVECAYYGLVNNIVIYYQWSEEWLWHNSNTNEYERDFSKSMKFGLNNLRTAIAEHDSREFKVGDLVCFNDSRIMFPNGETKTNELFRVVRSDGLEVDLTEIGKLNVYKTWVGDLSHATPEEIKAGHRIDDTTDNCSDIRNHVSPSTKVVDL
ncbi:MULTISPECIES: hypothetical protein [Acinetobacter]|uniref:hypothetical protein n=1 Tax=Acinetobacter TaxID=469 RepID=UPI000CFE4AE0|nr:hypothetical protein [Acinetobacter sp. MYb10]QLD61415.1 hypothetical protein CQZ96_009095 [Acinetobacter sp. MYb10]